MAIHLHIHTHTHTCITVPLSIYVSNVLDALEYIALMHVQVFILCVPNVYVCVYVCMCVCVYVCNVG